jgi:hypothetical protein
MESHDGVNHAKRMIFPITQSLFSLHLTHDGCTVPTKISANESANGQLALANESAYIDLAWEYEAPKMRLTANNGNCRSGCLPVSYGTDWKTPARLLLINPNLATNRRGGRQPRDKQQALGRRRLSNVRALHRLEPKMHD